MQRTSGCQITEITIQNKNEFEISNEMTTILYENETRWMNKKHKTWKLIEHAMQQNTFGVST